MFQNLSKKTIVIIIIAVVLAVGLGICGYIYWNKWQKARAGIEAIDNLSQGANKISENASRGALPSIDTNPLDNKPDLNPVDKINPFQNIKTNPFE